MTMRHESLEEYYKEYRNSLEDPNNQLHQEPSVIDWKYWRLVNNRFPYTKMTTAHALVVLKRNCSLYKISSEELVELWVEILPWADKIYDTSMINLSAMRSIEGTPHIHLVTYLPEYK